MESEEPYVEKVYSNFSAILKHLSKLKPQGVDEDEDSIIQGRGNFETHGRKFIIIMAASYYEKIVMEILETYISKIEDKFAKNLSLKLIKEKYSSLFNFDIDKFYYPEGDNGQEKRKAIVGKIYTFLKKFGEDFNRYCEKEINKDAELEQAIEYFLTINCWRNGLVHGRYDEDFIKRLPRMESIHEQFLESKKFIDWLPKVLEDYKKS